MELEARVMLMTVDMQDGDGSARITLLKLEREKVIFFPLTWTVVHPIDRESPLYGKTAEDLRRPRGRGADPHQRATTTRSARRCWRAARTGTTRSSGAGGLRPRSTSTIKGDLVLEVSKVGEIAP